MTLSDCERGVMLSCTLIDKSDGGGGVLIETAGMFCQRAAWKWRWPVF